MEGLVQPGGSGAARVVVVVAVVVVTVVKGVSEARSLPAWPACARAGRAAAALRRAGPEASDRGPAAGGWRPAAVVEPRDSPNAVCLVSVTPDWVQPRVDLAVQDAQV